MQFWPRKRAKRSYARIRSWPSAEKAAPLGFAGYKAGMTHIMVTQSDKKGTLSTAVPVTVVECPPLKVASVRIYSQGTYGPVLATEIVGSSDKELGRKVPLPKKTTEAALEALKKDEIADIRLGVYTQPKLTGIGKKKPELFEMGLGGTTEEKLSYAKEKLGKEIHLADAVLAGATLDAHAVTKGKGFQGPVKRFGVGLKHHKSEKGRRAVGTLGGWKAQGHFMYRVAHAGRMGYNQRTEYNKWVLMVSDKPDEVNPKGGFLRYGVVKNPYMLVRGSLAGPCKRLVRFVMARRPGKRTRKAVPPITHISQLSKQRK